MSSTRFLEPCAAARETELRREREARHGAAAASFAERRDAELAVVKARDGENADLSAMDAAWCGAELANVRSEIGRVDLFDGDEGAELREACENVAVALEQFDAAAAAKVEHVHALEERAREIQGHLWIRYRVGAPAPLASGSAASSLWTKASATLRAAVHAASSGHATRRGAWLAECLELAFASVLREAHARRAQAQDAAAAEARRVREARR